MRVVSFFAGCGGLDLGFEQAGFDVVWANEWDKTIHETYKLNHPHTVLCTKDIRDLKAGDIPPCDGFIGGPPCQSWSFGGKQLGLDDERGKLFLDYIRLVKEVHPKFFVIENVEGIIGDKHFHTFLSFLSMLESVGYKVNYSLLNAADYRIPQDRKRVFIVGFTKEMNCKYKFPIAANTKVCLRQAIGDLTSQPRFYDNEIVLQNTEGCLNHDVYIGTFDTKFMARNRVRGWNEQSFTIQAQAKNCPLHPQAPPMQYISANKRIFVPGKEHLYRRMSVRECARIQSFPDGFRFIYNHIKDGYKMVGNAVPPRLAKYIALSIKNALKMEETIADKTVLVAYYRNDNQLELSVFHKLYYVRAGFRRGALQFPVGEKQPDYLLLHNKQSKMLFVLAKRYPKQVSCDELTMLGFKPSGDNYWAFFIECIEENEDLSKINLERKGRQSAFPYLTTMAELLYS
ncbi:MAG: DNA cytosine methyltransferase [Prevotellamassilia sp.]|nr:DNA cytosine methyltransferase [Prevotellamassilia sp.]